MVCVDCVIEGGGFVDHRQSALLGLDGNVEWNGYGLLFMLLGVHGRGP